ncbi:PASTA domain-containing protein [bacterium]|nr:PASTA domain-containing protein [bacterium]
MGRVKRLFFALLKSLIIIISLLCLSIISALITMKLVSRMDLVKVPSIVGKDTVYALEQTNRFGLRLKITGDQFSDSIPENHIVSQDPKPFELTRRDRAVKVILSKGSEKVSVPNIVDEPWLRAQDLIRNAGLKIGRLTRSHQERILKNKVISQNPAGNSMVSRGHAVDLLLSDGEPPKGFFMPELRGLTLKTALVRLRNTEMVPGNVSYLYKNGLPPNTIISHSPKAGFRVTSGDKIDLVVSKSGADDQEEAGIYTTLTYRVPSGTEKREVKILLLDGDEGREIFHQIRSPGDEIELLVKISRHTKAQIYIDNELIEERQF